MAGLMRTFSDVCSGMLWYGSSVLEREPRTADFRLRLHSTDRWHLAS